MVPMVSNIKLVWNGRFGEMLSYMYPPTQDAGVLTIPVMVPIIPIIFPRLLGGVTSATNACHAGPPITPHTSPPNPRATPPTALTTHICQKFVAKVKPSVEMGDRIREIIMHGLRPIRSVSIPVGTVSTVEIKLITVPMIPHCVLVRPTISTE